MVKSGNTFGLPALLLGSALGVSAFAQSSTPPAQPAQDQAAPSSSSTMNPNDNGTYATGKPLQNESKEGFWGKMNPLARKKWVNRQTAPIKGQVNELDQLQAKNANDIKDVDLRSQAGIKNAMNSANQLASNASTRTDALGNTVGNLDQYQTVSSTAVPFVSGRTTLGPTAKS